MEFIAELLGWWALAVVKFLFLPWIMVLGAGKGFIETFLVTISGAGIGVWLISFFGEKLFLYLSARARKKGKKVFTRSRRHIVRVKNRYGLQGLMMIGGLISVPVTTLLAVKYYRHVRFMQWKVIGGFTIWAAVLTSLATLVKVLFYE
jgi:hypothetical protein